MGRGGRQRWVLASILAALVVACVGPGDEPDGDAGAPSAAGVSGESPLPADSTAVRVGAFLLRYVEAVAERDTSTLRTLYVADDRFVWMEDGAVRYRSPDEVLAGLDAFPPGTPVRTVLGEVETASLGAGAVHAWTPFTTTVGQGDEAFSFGGMLSLVLEARGDGWRIVGGHTSSRGSR